MRTFKKPIILVAILATVLTSSSLTSLAAQKNANRNSAPQSTVKEAAPGNDGVCVNPDGVCTQDGTGLGNGGECSNPDGVCTQDGTGLGNGGECSNPDGVCAQDGTGLGNGGARKGNGNGCTL